MSATFKRDGCALSAMLLYIILLCSAAAVPTTTYVSLFNGTLQANFSSNTTHLFTTLSLSSSSAADSVAASFGTSSTGGMVGPVVSCYVPPGNAASAVCIDIDADYSVTAAEAQVTKLVNATTTSLPVGSSGWAMNLETPLDRLGLLTAQGGIAMMFAVTGWNASTSLPTRHASPDARTITSVIMPSSTTAASPSPPTTTVRSVLMSLAENNLNIEVQYNTSNLWGSVTIPVSAAGYVGTFGIVRSGMDGSMIACCGGDGGSSSSSSDTTSRCTSTPSCFDVDGHDSYLALPSEGTAFTTLTSASSNATHAVLSFTAPRSRFPYLSDDTTAIISYCWSRYDASSRLPAEHDSGWDHGTVVVNFLTGAVTNDTYAYASRVIAYLIVGAMLVVAVGLAVYLTRVRKIVFTPSTIYVLQALVVLLILVMIVIVMGLAQDDFDNAMKSAPGYRSYGEATAFLLSIILVPTTKHAGLGVLVGSSYERLLFLHPVLGTAVLVTMTIHMRGMFSSVLSEYTSSSILATPKYLYGFLAWISMLCVVLPAIFIRRQAYHLFRVTHCLFVLVLLFSALHCDHLIVMLAPSLLLWVVDVGLRVRSSITASANVVDLEYDAPSEIITLRLSVGWSRQPAPGSYVFLLVPSLSPVMHPFTVAMADMDPATAVRGGGTQRLVLFIKNNGGSTFTAKLAEAATNAAHLQAPPMLRVAVFGPHGKLQIQLDRCGHVVLVCGGIGITPMLSILHNIATNDNEGTTKNDIVGSSSTSKEVTLIWATRGARGRAMFRLFSAPLQQLTEICKSKNIVVNIMMFDTNPVASDHHHHAADIPAAVVGNATRCEIEGITSLSSERDPPPPPLDASPHPPQQLIISEGRPNFYELFSAVNEANQSKASRGGAPVGCYVCGPPTFSKAAATAASSCLFLVHCESFEF